ncbi:very short patch repair endonuclease [Mesorhizobium australicum]|uniref:very short patch repair endonuclease n=1 Tax=Mesorhizobium australicum TaxID=536018 RepID=UPI0033383CDE
MTDTVAPEVRSRMMAAIRGKDTKPELAVRHGLHSLGFRYSLHTNRFPGRPDMVLPKYRAVIWTHGCYWHGHDCGAAKLPSSNETYWHPKIKRTRARDIRNAEAVAAAGWRSLTVWECCLRGRNAPGIARVLDAAAEWLRNGKESREFHVNSNF